MSQTWSAWWGLSLVRTILGWIDWAFFQILGWVYEVFCAISNAELFSSETIYTFIGKIQLILGIFMVFKLSIMILKSMVNPDMINDKQAGFSNILTRIITSLVMLSLIMPLNIPSPKNSFETELNNNGIMFGTLYSLQKRILANDVLGQLVLGHDAPRQGTDGSVQSNRLPAIKDKFISTIAKGFVRRNLKDEDDSSSLMCDVEITKDNNYENASSSELFLEHLNDDCDGDGLFEKKYALAYIPIVGAIVAIIFTILFASFSIDIAIRSIKLSVLRLIAPIPIISYMEPGQEKKGAFGNWVKILTSTYLDLFIRLGIVYFVLFLIDDIMTNGLILNGSMGVSGLTSVVAFIVIVIGLLMFAKMAPKFITDALGIQSHMSNIGLSGVLGGAAMAFGGGGLAGFGFGAMNGMKAGIEGETTGKPVPVGAAWSQNRDLMAKIRTGDKDAQGGFVGKMHDYMNYQTREKNARRMGVGAYDVAEADYIAKQYKKMMESAQSEMEEAKILYQHDPTNAQYKDAYQKANQKYGKYAEAYQKAQKRAESMDKARGQLGVGPRVIDTREVKPTLGQRLMGKDGTEGTYRSPIKADGDYDISNMPDSIKPFELDDDIKNSITSEKRDPNGFEGTLDDSSWTSTGHGARSRPGPGPRP